ncbi:TolC family protein [Acetoanaerobium sticklandii]|uniref:TolC family protein n=1 Tax=Acetoanaerobium sticklandii TaxID=1511 RepID=UPI003A9153D4
MNKNITKIGISLVLIFSIVNPNFIYANKAEMPIAENLEILSYDEAIKLAFKENNDIKNLKLEKDSNTIKIDDALDNFGTSLYDPQVLALMKLQKNDKLNTEKVERTENYIKQGLAFKIKSIFNNINLIKNDIELKKLQLDNSIKKRNTMALKLEYGMESKTNITTKDIEISQSKKDIEALEKDLDDHYIELNKLLGFDRFTRYEIEKLDFEYSPVNDTQEDIDFKVTRAISSDINIWGKEQQLDIQRIDVDFYSLNYISGAPSNQQSSPAPYESLELDARISSNDLEQAKEDLKDSVIGKYNSIKKLENTYENTLLKLKDLEEKKRVLEVAIKAGTAINQDYLDLTLGLIEIQNGIEKIQSQHALLVEMYNNPLLVGGNIG